MSEDNNNQKKSDPKEIENFSEAEQKEIIAKFKEQLAAENEDAILLSATIMKSLL